MPVYPDPPSEAYRDDRRTTVAVVLCTFNGQDHLPALLESLSRQSRLPDELIVQDDGSVDDTVGIIQRFAASAPFPVRCERNLRRLGSTRNFEAALVRCNASIVALADQDDVWYPEKLERITHEFRLDPTITMVFSNADLIDADGRPLDRQLWQTRRVAAVLRRHSVIPARLFARRALTTGCTMALRRRAVRAALPFPADLEDADAPMRHDRWLSLIAASVGTVTAIAEPLLAFRVHAAQETGVLVGSALPAAVGSAGARLIIQGNGHGMAAREARHRQLHLAAERADACGDSEEADALAAIAEGHLLRPSGSLRPREEIRQLRRAVVRGVYEPGPWGWMSIAGDAIRSIHPRRQPARTR